MKFCKDCKYFTDGNYSDWCNVPHGQRDLVTGKHKVIFAFVMRQSTSACGPEAVLFEEKPATISFWQKLRNKFK